MRRPEPSATAVGFDHRLKGCTRAILAGALLCLLGEAAQGAPAPGEARGTKRSARSERQSAGRAAEKQTPKQPTLPLATDDTFNGCHKVPSGKRLVRVTVPPKTDLNQLIRWLSSVTCKSFVYATDDATSSGREVTIVAPTYITPEDAFRLVLDSLDAVGLTLRPAGSYFQIIQSQYAHVTSVPVYDYEGRRVHDK
jgi:hypothetical protein